jgi:hypothetical protein
LTRDQKRDRTRVDAARHKSAEVEEGDKNLLIVVDLARMTEEVVESVVSAYRFSQSFERSGSKPLNGEREPVSVILDIDRRDSWSTAVPSVGAWTRVLTNIGK